jgi:predicted transcriptional regulator
MADSADPRDIIALTAEIVAAYVGNHSVPPADIAALISQVHHSLVRLGNGAVERPAEVTKPAVSVRKSVMPDYLVCLEDGKKFKSLKRHLRTHYNLSPDQYREKWALPVDYPMVAPNYAKKRSQLAKTMGLGQQRRRRAR